MSAVRSPVRLKLSSAIVAKLRDHAATRTDVEVCGLLGLSPQGTISVYPVPNVADQPQREFFMEPRAQVAVMRTMRERGEELFAIYHSHPDAPAFPSQKDLQQAAYPGVVYLIVSLPDQEVRAYHFDGQDFSPMPLIEA